MADSDELNDSNVDEIQEGLSNVCIEDEVGKPKAKEEVGKPKAEKEVGKPKAEDKVGKPEAEEEVGKPEAEEEVGKPKAEDEGVGKLEAKDEGVVKSEAKDEGVGEPDIKEEDIISSPSSKLEGEKDFKKFQIARNLKKHIIRIRDSYKKDWKSKEMSVRQRGVALYLIDRLVFRAGNKKSGNKVATFGCCSLRCEHIKLHDQKNGKEYVVEFDFPGKCNIRYQNEVPVEETVYKNLESFMENKEGSEDLFDCLDTSILNSYLSTLIPGFPELTVKVFRTCNASSTFQDQLKKLSKEGDSIKNKMLAFKVANKQVAVLCNHQHAVSKGHETIMEEYLKTSLLHYIDPRIVVAWCKKMEVTLEEIYTETERKKFQWAINSTESDYEF
uniref:DNA topoisomerase I n=1 Tax=Rhabditophanes sp. KR3021 TaxID=114890 RepID=A0AC35TU22_9BILA